MLEIQSIMTKNVFSVSPETLIVDALKILIESNVTGLPVLDENNHLVGIISEKDMLSLLLGDIVTKTQKVKNFMTTEVKTFKPDAKLIEVCEFFSNTSIRRVPIVDDDNKLVGIVSRRDFIKLIYKNQQ
ncbi:MAG: CBS domain-containing protein [Candidatus Omnitrophica bacterium]|nr:CBS domain-containing protein [Candidatus Omnitrophota bacterium]